MAIKKVYIGSLGPFIYDDAEDISDPDGDFAGQKQRAIATDGVGYIEGSPSDDDDVARKSDVSAATPTSADEDTEGIIEIATNAEAVAKSAGDKAVVPSNLPSVMSAPGPIGNSTPDEITTDDLKITNDEADATLSGTPKLFLIKDSTGTQYYFKAYPTKS